MPRCTFDKLLIPGVIFSVAVGLRLWGVSSPAAGRAASARPSVPASRGNSLWLYSHFRDDDKTHLRLSYSYNAIDWFDIGKDGAYQATALLDPSVILVDGTYYFITTPAQGANLQFFSSRDLIHFSRITTVNMGEFVPGATTAWAPEWWHDPDGKYYFWVAVTNEADRFAVTAPFLPYLVPFDLSSGTVAAAPMAIPLEGTTQSRTFDFFPYFDGTQYYLFYVDQQPVGSGGDVVQPIAYATATSLTGPYTQQTSPNIDYFGWGTFQTEAPTLVSLPDNCGEVAGSSGVRIIADTWTMAPPGRRKYSPYYIDSCTALGALFSPPSFAGAPKPLHISASEHGTVISLTTASDTQGVYQAAHWWTPGNDHATSFLSSQKERE